MSNPVVTNIEHGVATLTLNRPEVLNALDPAMAEGLRAATADVAGDEAVRCVLVRGAGGNFMAGGDIGYFHRCLSLSPDERAAVVKGVIEVIHGAISNLRAMPKPVVASVEGACAGFGVSLMAACDLAVAAESAVFSLAYSRLGVTPDGGSTFFLPRLVGWKRATALALLADRFDARAALDMGLVNQVTAPDALGETAGALASRLAKGPANAFAATKTLLNESSSATLEEQLEAEAVRFIECVRGAEFEEGVRAFVEKRKSRFN